MNAGVAAKRRLGNWIDSYIDYTHIVPSPLLFRKWTAIFYIAAAMERRIWVKSMGSNLYPNLYIFLVGPPGVGKGQAIYPGEAILRGVPDLKVGPSDLTAASLIDALHESVRRFIQSGDPPLVQFNSLTIISRELGVLIPGWDAPLMNNLTDIYDGFVVEQKRRGKDLKIKIESPQINLLGACTPSYLNETLPQGAWDQGFLSRTILIYSGDRQVPDPFIDEATVNAQTTLHRDLLHDLKTIGADFGAMSFTTPAAIAIRAWLKAGQIPVPQHQRLQYYNSRRLAHLLKLCMVASMAESNNKIVSLDNYSTALNWLIEAEKEMPDIFKSMMSGGDSATMNETWNHAWRIYSKEKKPLQEHRIVSFLHERVPAHSVLKILDLMVRSKMFEVQIIETGKAGYVPMAREVRQA